MGRKDRQLSPKEEDAAYEAWCREQMADIDSEFDPRNALAKIGVKVFESYSRGRGRRRRDPVDVILARRRQGSGFRQVNLTYIDGTLDDAAHHGLTHVDANERYSAAEGMINEVISRHRNKR